MKRQILKYKFHMLTLSAFFALGILPSGIKADGLNATPTLTGAHATTVYAPQGITPSRALLLSFQAKSNQAGAKDFHIKPLSVERDQNGYSVALSLPTELTSSADQTFQVVSFLTEQSRTVFSTVDTFAGFKERQRLATAPVCAPLSNSFRNVTQSQRGLFESLVEVRKRRVEFNKERLQKELTPELIESLSRLELRLGFRPDYQLNLNLSAEELNKRLDAILNSLKAAS